MSRRILIAENDEHARGLLAGWLEEAGYVCSTTDSGGALTEARRHSPDAAIVGVGVPDNGGMFVVRTLRTQPDQPGLVVVSTPPSFEVAVAAARLGVIDCLPWPTSAPGVLEAVQRAVDWRLAQRGADEQSRRLAEEVAFGREHLKDTIKRVDPETAPAVLLAILEARSVETHDHSSRVARSAVVLAGTLNLAPHEVAWVRRAALLHDIGKIAVPERLLKNAGPLTDSDLSVLRSHVGIGQDVLKTVPALAPVAEIVGATHERYDGTGYPAGLRGRDIPIGARIITVVDAYDAMTSVRAYHDPVSHEEANAELIRCAGTHFDPDVVRAWVQMTEVRLCS